MIYAPDQAKIEYLARLGTRETYARYEKLVEALVQAEKDVDKARARLSACKETVEYEDAQLVLGLAGANEAARKAELVIARDGTELYQVAAKETRAAQATLDEAERLQRALSREISGVGMFLRLRTAQIEFMAN